MSKIKFERIDENEVAVIIDSNVPLDMVEQLTKNLESKGLVEDKISSSVTHRFFYRPASRADDIADLLIKSLQGMAKEDENPYSKEIRNKTAERNRINDRRARAKLPSLTDAQVAAAKPPQKTSVVAPTPQIDVRPFGTKPKTLFDPNMSGKVNYKKSEDEDEEVEKSAYGPKKGGQYTAVDNAKRKANNTGDVVGAGPNVNAKSYSSKPGQLSGKQSADLTARIQNKANKKQPVKVYTPEEIAAMAPKYNPDGTLKKSWGQHLPFPNAEEEIMRLSRADRTQVGEDALANQLGNLMAGKAMLGNAPPAQPTDQQMFGHLVVTEEMQKANEKKWQGAAFDWLAEAAKPISQKFNSEEEELAYWKSIKVGDRDDGQAGY